MEDESIKEDLSLSHIKKILLKIYVLSIAFPYRNNVSLCLHIYE